MNDKTKAPAEQQPGSTEELSRTGAGPAVGKDAEGAKQEGVNANVSGLGANGEFKVGKISLAIRNGEITLLKENEGSETRVDEATLEGVLDEAFFVRRAEGTGNVKIGN